jgi:cysteine synthase A
MTLLAPLFQAEAALQANILASDDVRAQAQQDLEQAKRQHKVLIYTYGLSPFSTEAVALLEASGYPYTKMELGLEWFLLGGYGSALRQALGAQVPNGATSLPKIFIGGQCVGGCAELASLVESGELDTLMKQARVKNSS